MLYHAECNEVSKIKKITELSNYYMSLLADHMWVIHQVNC